MSNTKLLIAACAGVGATALLARYASTLANASGLKRFFTEDINKYNEGGFLPDMTKQEAAMILNVPLNPSKDQVLKNHRKLMKLNHPDKQTGSAFLGTKINEAKDVLLGTKKTKQ